VSLARLQEHRDLWRAKPTLRSVYEVWFDRLVSGLPMGARVLEVGAGPGFLAPYVRAQRPDLRFVASDILATPWNDLVANALRLPVAAESVDAVVGLDFIHHLARPGDFFAESARVLRAGGVVSAVEPWITPLSLPVYGLLHQERCRLGVDAWKPYPEGDRKDAFDGDSALVWALARRPAAEWMALGFVPPVVGRLSSFAYLMSLGFKPGNLLPRPLVRPLLALDALTGPLARWVGLRAHLVWRRVDRRR
jgi:SAM-dependent methyltransferase